MQLHRLAAVFENRLTRQDVQSWSGCDALAMVSNDAQLEILRWLEQRLAVLLKLIGLGQVSTK